jgi:hypothetical protein
MTPEERDIIGRFIARVGGAQQGNFSGGSSVPATQTALPAIDPEADRFIGDQFNANPQARYRITQMAFVQEAALAEAQNRIKRLEYDLQQAQQALQQAQSQGGQRGGGLFSGLFGGGQQQARPAYQPQYAPPPPQPAYPPGYQPGMFRSGGSGFLGSALTTAAGVAGGVLAADALTSMFSGHGEGFGGGGFGGGGFGGGEVVNETVVNNYGDSGSDPWAGAGTAPDAPSGDWTSGGGGGDPWAGGGAAPDVGGDSGGDWGGGGDGGGWDDNSGGGDGGF